MIGDELTQGKKQEAKSFPFLTWQRKEIIILSSFVGENRTDFQQDFPTYSHREIAGRFAQVSKNFLKRLFFADNLTSQVADFKEVFFCFSNGQFIGTRMKSGLSVCQEGVAHKVIHSLCGFLKKSL